MSLETLPDEILIIIFKQLDLRSLQSVYLSCARFRSLTSKYGYVKSCDLTLSVMAKAEKLKSPFFRDISKNIQQLNLSGLRNLNKTALLPAIKKLEVLNELDVTYTNITLTNFIDIFKACPSIKDISINFHFGKQEQLTEESSFHPYQEVFENMLNVHFVCNVDILMCSPLPGLVLQKAKLKKLQYTVIDCDDDEFHSFNNLVADDGVPINFDQFVSKMSCTKFQLTATRMSHPFPLQYGSYKIYKYMTQMHPFGSIDFDKYEVLVLTTKHSSKSPNCCYATSTFESFLKNCSLLHPTTKINFKLIVDKSYYNHIQLFGNVCVMLWNKSNTNFDDKFFSDLWCSLKPFFPCYFDSKSNTPIAYNYDLFVTLPYDTDEEKEQDLKDMEDSKRKRIAMPCSILNFDNVFKEQKTVKLSILFEISIIKAVSLSASSDYLKKLTFLSLSGQVRYGANFYDILFRCCDNLTTLSVKANSLWPCSSAIARALPSSQSLKNILVIDRDIRFSLMFSSMSKCKTLENVHIFDTSEAVTFSNPSIVLENCLNMYCMCLNICSSLSAKKKYMDLLKSIPNEKKTFVQLLSNKYIICDGCSEVFKIHYL